MPSHLRFIILQQCDNLLDQLTIHQSNFLTVFDQLMHNLRLLPGRRPELLRHPIHPVQINTIRPILEHLQHIRQELPHIIAPDQQLDSQSHSPLPHHLRVVVVALDHLLQTGVRDLLQEGSADGPGADQGVQLLQGLTAGRKLGLFQAVY